MISLGMAGPFLKEKREKKKGKEQKKKKEEGGQKRSNFKMSHV